MKLTRTLLIARTLASALITAPAAAAAAQNVSQHIAAGDAAIATFNSAAALDHFQAAVALDSTHAEALGKASRAAVDVGEGEQNRARRDSLFRLGERYARRAVAANPNDAEIRFHLARALGRSALIVGVRQRVRYANEIRSEALAALKLQPEHAGALHVMGVWNAEVMRLNGVERFFARNVLGGRVFGTANWKDAVSYMERAVAADPERLTHRLDLAKIYIDVKEKENARQQLEFILRADKRTDVNDPLYKREAREALDKLR
ncbi:MAG: hypothetical protein ACT4R6_10095 [Gemmatimonadaceae bacterium]